MANYYSLRLRMGEQNVLSVPLVFLSKVVANQHSSPALLQNMWKQCKVGGCPCRYVAGTQVATAEHL